MLRINCFGKRQLAVAERAAEGLKGRDEQGRKIRCCGIKLEDEEGSNENAWSIVDA